MLTTHLLRISTKCFKCIFIVIFFFYKKIFSSDCEFKYCGVSLYRESVICIEIFFVAVSNHFFLRFLKEPSWIGWSTYCHIFIAHMTLTNTNYGVRFEVSKVSLQNCSCAAYVNSHIRMSHSGLVPLLNVAMKCMPNFVVFVRVWNIRPTNSCWSILSIVYVVVWNWIFFFFIVPIKYFLYSIFFSLIFA